MGADIANSIGVVLDPGTTANSKPASYTEIVAATTMPFDALAICLGNEGTRQDTGKMLLDVAIGAAGSEVDILTNLPIGGEESADIVGPMYIPPLPVHVPEGERISARVQSDAIGTRRFIDAVIYGLV